MMNGQRNVYILGKTPLPLRRGYQQMGKKYEKGKRKKGGKSKRKRNKGERKRGKGKERVKYMHNRNE